MKFKIDTASIIEIHMIISRKNQNVKGAYIQGRLMFEEVRYLPVDVPQILVESSLISEIVGDAETERPQTSSIEPLKSRRKISIVGMVNCNANDVLPRTFSKGKFS